MSARAAVNAEANGAGTLQRRGLRAHPSKSLLASSRVGSRLTRPGWRKGRRSGLKIRWPKGRPGSNPGLGTNRDRSFRARAANGGRVGSVLPEALCRQLRRAAATTRACAKPRTDPNRLVVAAGYRWVSWRNGRRCSFLLRARSFDSCWAGTGAQYPCAPCQWCDAIHNSSRLDFVCAFRRFFGWPRTSLFYTPNGGVFFGLLRHDRGLGQRVRIR